MSAMRTLLDRARQCSLAGVAAAAMLGALLGAAQQGALRHGIGHVAERLAPGSAPEKQSELPKR